MSGEPTYTVYNEIENLEAMVEGLGDENTELEKVIRAAVESLKDLPKVPLRDLESSIEVIADLLEGAL